MLGFGIYMGLLVLSIFCFGIGLIPAWAFTAFDLFMLRATVEKINDESPSASSQPQVVMAQSQPVMMQAAVMQPAVMQPVIVTSQ